MKKINVLVLFSIAYFGFIFTNDIHGQIISKKVPSDIIPEKGNLTDIERIRESDLSKSYDLTKSLPSNYVVDGSVDYTKNIQEALNKYDVVSFPDFPILINKAGLTIRSNASIFFKPKSVLLMMPNSEDTYEILRVHNVSNVNIIDAVIIGDRKSHKSKTGEWGMGIAIRTSTNVNVFNAKISDCWGDGIYVGSTTGVVNGKRKLLKPSENINIYNTSIDGSGRNGISIVSVKGLNIANSIISNSIYKFPKAGIDIEPVNFVENVIISNTLTYNNLKGIDFFLKSISTNVTKNISVDVRDFRDYGSAIGIRIAGYKEKVKKANESTIGGAIVIDNSQFSGNKLSSLVIEPNQSFAPRITFSNIKTDDLMLKSKSGNIKLKDMPQVRKGLTSTNNIIFK